MLTNTNRYRLRPRRTQDRTDKTVKSITLLIEHRTRLSSHRVIFDGTHGSDRLTLSELHRHGFIGEIDLTGAYGRIIEAEVDCDPKEGRGYGFTFKVTNARTGVPIRAKIIRYEIETE